MAVLSEFNPVWFEGAASSSDVPSKWPVGIAGHGYVIEPKLYRRSFIPTQRDARDDTVEPGEQTLSPAGLWRRSQSDWSLGAGQDWLDEDESTRRRFNASLGIDVFTEREVCLLPETQEKRDSGNSNLRLLTVGTRLYVVDGTALLFSNGAGSEQNATWTTGWTTATGIPASTILDIAYSGSHVYVLAGDNSIYRATPGTTAFTLFYNPTAVTTRLWAGLGRLFASDGRSFYEITATPSETLIFQHPDPNMVWSAFAAAPTGIYVGGNVSDRGEIRHTWVRDDGAAFVAPVVAGEFINERVLSLATAGNNLLIGTSAGFRYSPIDNQNTGLDFGPVVSDVGAVNQIITDNVLSETFAWFTWSNIQSGISGLGRIRVARFTEPKVPAYASDIYSVSGGTALTAASLSGRRYFGISGEGFFGATANFVASGTISTGRIRYGMLDTKVFVDLQWRTASMPAGGRIYATVVFDNGAIVVTEAQESTSSTSSTVNSLGPVSAEWAEVTFTFERPTNQTQCPTFRAWVLRSVPAPELVQKFLVPIRLSHKVLPPRGPIQGVHSEEELEFIAALVQSQQIVKYQEGSTSFDVHVVNYEVQGVDWDSTGHHFETVTLIELHSIR
jgi:hypothetical protein